MTKNNKIDKKTLKQIEAHENLKTEVRKSWGNVLKETKVDITVNGETIKVNLIQPTLITTSLTRNQFKKLGVDIEKDVFKDVVEKQQEIGEADELKLNIIITNLLQEKYIGKILKVALAENITEKTIDGVTNTFFNKENENYIILNNIINRFIDYERDLSIADDEVPETTILEILLLMIMFLLSPN